MPAVTSASLTLSRSRGGCYGVRQGHDGAGKGGNKKNRKLFERSVGIKIDSLILRKLEHERISINAGGSPRGC